jgi:hypothetical protein
VSLREEKGRNTRDAFFKTIINRVNRNRLYIETAQIDYIINESSDSIFLVLGISHYYQIKQRFLKVCLSFNDRLQLIGPLLLNVRSQTMVGDGFLTVSIVFQ